MAFAQLYYTSCREGLGGLSGFQFNAATPGIAGEVMTGVERLTAYQPPPGLGYPPTDAEIASCPVSLAYAPAETAIVATTRFVGADFSGRYGNYFAHALVTTDAAADLGGLLPIELWDAPFWKAAESPSRELPALPAPLPRGALDRAGVQEFLDGHRHAGQLAGLLSAAADAAVRRDRSVVVVETTSAAAAHWIAAVSYLLPPRLVGALGFTTYHAQPSYCDLQLVGTVPAAGIHTRDAAFDQGFFLFDATGGRASRIDVDPVARLVCDLGVERAGAIWAYADRLAAGGERTLADWRPLVAASAAVAGVPLPDEEREAVTAWLQDAASRIGRDEVEAVVDALSGADVSDDDLRRLAAAAGRGSAPAALATVERRIVDRDLAAIAAGRSESRPPPAPLTAAGDYAARRCAERLADATDGEVPALLAWALAVRIRLPHDALTRCGEQIVGPGLLATPSNPELHRVVTAWAPVRDGAAAHLEARAGTDPADVEAALEHGALAVFPAEVVDGHPRLHELALVCGARLDPARRIAVLDRLLAAREQAGPVDEAVLAELVTTLWTAQPWSPTEAQQVLDVLTEEQVATTLVLDRLAATIGGAATADTAYLSLCDRLSGQKPVLSRLPRDIVLAVAWGRWARPLLRAVRAGAAVDGRGRDDAALQLALRVGEAPQPVRDEIERHLAGVAPRVSAESLVGVLDMCPPGVAAAGLSTIGAELARSADPALGARLFSASVSHQLAARPDRRALAEEALGPVRDWRRRDVDEMGQQLDRLDPSLRPRFDAWCQRNRPKGLGRVVRGRSKRLGSR